MTDLRAAFGATVMLVLGLGALACASGGGLPDQPLAPAVVLRQQTFPLASGLHVVVQEDHGQPLVAVTTVVGVGASADPPGQEGLAHLVEHLAYRPLAERLKRTGASYNATTEPDRTTYFALAHKDQLAELLELEGARLARTLEGVTADLLAIERDVIRNEARERGIYPRVVGELFKRAFPLGHPLARSAGADDALTATTVESAQAFVTQHYRPANITVVVAGDVDPRAVAQLLDGWPAQLIEGPPGAAPRRPFQPPAAARVLPPRPRSNRLERLTLPVASRRLMLAWPAPADVASDPFLLMSHGALATRLGFLASSGVATPKLLPSRDGSLMAIEVLVSSDADPAELSEQVVDAVVNVRRDDAARRTLGLMKWAAATEVMRRSTQLLASSISLGHYYAATGRASFYKDSLEQLAAVDPLDVTGFLWDALTRDRVVALLIEPEGAAAHGAQGVGPALLPDAVPPRHDVEGAEVVNLVRMGPDQIRQMVRVPNLGRLPRFRASNRLEVVVVPRSPGSPVAEVSVQLAAGDVHLAPFGVAGLARDFSFSDCREETYLLEVGGVLRAHARQEPTRYSAEVFAGNVANALAAVGNQLRCRKLRDEALSDARAQLQRTAQRLARQEQQANVQAARAFWRGLYPDGAFGLIHRDNAALQALTEPELEAALRAQYLPAGALAVLITDRPLAELRPLVEQHLGPWQGPPSPPAVRRASEAGAPPARRSIRIFHEPGAAQDRLLLGCRLVPATEETFPAYELLEAIVRREANQVRQSWGATYGFDVEVVQQGRGVAHLTVEGNVEPRSTADALARLLEFTGRLASAGPHIKTFTVERWDLGRELNLRFATAGGLADAMLWASQRGWSSSVWDAYPERLASLQRGSIRDLLAPCAGREIVTVVGDEAALTARLRAAGLLTEPGPAPGKAREVTPAAAADTP